MNKTILLQASVLAFFGVMGVSGTSSASFGITTLQTSGTGKAAEPEKVAPATNCDLGLYGAFATPGDTETDSYAFSGTCDINVAPKDKAPVIQNVKVQIMGEWSPKMKRASELVKVIHPDKTVQFSTWATCDKDPYIMGSGAKCENQGIGANDFNMFLSTADAPFAKNRAISTWVYTLRSRITARTQLKDVGNITGIERPLTVEAGDAVKASITFTGGPGACPMRIDFGDGTSVGSTLSSSATKHSLTKSWAKPGKYTIKAKAQPGCSGEYSAVINVTPKGGA